MRVRVSTMAGRLSVRSVGAMNRGERRSASGVTGLMAVQQSWYDYYYPGMKIWVRPTPETGFTLTGKSVDG